MPRKNKIEPRKNVIAPNCPENEAVLNQWEDFRAQWLRPLEAADFLGLDQNTIQHYAREGAFLNAKQVGCEYLVPLHDLIWFKENRLGRRGRPRASEFEKKPEQPAKSRKKKHS